MKHLTSLLLLFVLGCTALPAAILPAAAADIDSSSTPHDTTEELILPRLPLPCCPRFTPPFHPAIIDAKPRCRLCVHHTRTTTTDSRPTHTTLPWINNFTIPVPTSSPSGKSFILEEIFPHRKSTTTTSKPATSTTTTSHLILNDIHSITSNAFAPTTTPHSCPHKYAHACIPLAPPAPRTTLIRLAEAAEAPTTLVTVTGTLVIGG